MKYCILLIVCLFGPINISNAQDVTATEINLTFTGKKLNVPAKIQHLKPNEYYQIKITGLNQNLYKVSINHSDTIKTKALEMPTFATFQLDAVSTLIAGISPKTTIIKKIAVKGEPTGLKSFGKYTTKYQTITVTSSIGEKMNEIKIDLTNHLEELRKIKTDIEDVQLEALKYYLNGILVTKLSVQGLDADATIKRIDNIRKNLASLQLQINTAQGNYFSFYKINKNAIDKDEDFKAADADIKSSYTQLLTACSDAYATVSAEKLRDILTTIVNTQNNKEENYVSFPIQFTKEEAKVEVLIEPRKPEYLLQSHKAIITFPMENLFYAGVGVSFYGAKLHDENYSTIGFQINDSVSNYRIKAEKTDNWEVGIAALLRLGTKFKKADWLGVHGTIGPGISISDKVKPRILTGVGISVGNKHMFTFDIGAIFGYVDRLSEGYDDGDILSVAPENITVSHLSTELFLSVGYLYNF